MTDAIKKLKELVDSSENIVFFGGAGVSTESGIPDFRSTKGLYNQEWKYPPKTIGGMGGRWQAEGRGDPEHRRTPSGCRQQNGL